MSSAHPNARAPRIVPISRMRSSGTVGCRSDDRTHFGQQAQVGRRAAPVGTQGNHRTRGEHLFQRIRAMAEPVVAPRAVDRRHPLGVGPEEADFLIVQIVAVDHQRTMGRGQQPQIFHRPSSGPAEGGIPCPNVFQQSPQRPRPTAAAVPIPLGDSARCMARGTRSAADSPITADNNSGCTV